MSSVWYNDLGKKVKDLFKKGYPTKNIAEIEVSHKTKNNKSLKAIVTSSRKGGALSAKLEDTWKIPEHELELFGSISSDSGEGLTGKVIWEPKSINGLKVTLSGVASNKLEEEKENNKRLIGLQVDYDSKKSYTGSVLFSYPLIGLSVKDRQPVVSGNAAFSHLGFTLGGNAEAKLPAEGGDNGLSKYGAALAYNSKDSNITFYSQSEKIDKKEEDEEDEYKALLGINFYHKLTPNLEVGSDIFCDTNKIGEDKPVKVHLGLTYQADKYATFRSKVDVAESKISLSYQHKVSDELSVTLGTEFASGLLVSEPKFGLGLAFSY